MNHALLLLLISLNLVWPGMVRALESNAVEAEAPSGTIKLNDQSIVGGELVLKTNEEAPNVVVVLGKAVIEGTITKDLVLVSSEVVVKGTVEGNIVSVLSKVQLEPTARVNRDFVNVASEVQKDDGAVVHGKETTIAINDLPILQEPLALLKNLQNKPDVLKTPSLPHLNSPGIHFHKPRFLFFYPWPVWIIFLIIIAGYTLLSLIFRQSVNRCSNNVCQHPFLSLVLGCIILLMFLPVTVLLVLTVVGILLIPFLLLALLLLLIFGKAGILSCVGRTICRALNIQVDPDSPLTILTGAVPFLLVMLIPVLAIFVYLLAMAMSVGSAMLALFGHDKPTAPTVPPNPPSHPPYQPVPPYPVAPNPVVPPAPPQPPISSLVPPAPTSAALAIPVTATVVSDPILHPLGTDLTSPLGSTAPAPAVAAPTESSSIPVPPGLEGTPTPAPTFPVASTSMLSEPIPSAPIGEPVATPELPPISDPIPPVTPPPAEPATPQTASTFVPPPFLPPPRLAPVPLPSVSMYQRAGLLERSIASLIDFAIVALVCTILPFGFGLLGFIWLAYHIALWLWRGATIGGIVMKIKVVRMDSQPLTTETAIIRCFSAFLSAIPAFLGFLWVAWDPEQQSWHDKIAGTTMIKVPEGISLN